MDGSPARYHIPFLHANDKTTHDKFVELLTDLPDLLAARVSPVESESGEEKHVYASQMQRRLCHLARTLVTEFPTIEYKYPHYAPGDDILYAIPFSDDVTDSEILVVMALWSLVCLLILTFSEDVKVRGSDLIQHHCQVILNGTASIVQIQDVYCFGTSIAPLKAVYMYSPDVKQRDEAMSLIQQLGGAFRFDGLLGGTE